MPDGQDSALYVNAAAGTGVDELHDRLESVVIAVFGAVLGLALGLVRGLCVQQVLALRGMTALAVPWGTVVAVVIGSAVVGIAAALLPALRTSRMNVLEAIAHK